MSNTTQPTKSFKTPLFKDLSDEALIREFIGWRTTAHNWNQMASGTTPRRQREKIAGGVLRSLRNVDIIVAIARKRGLALPVL